MPENEMVPVQRSGALEVMSVEDVIQRKALVQEVMKRVMIRDEKGNGNGHYGKIPGCGTKDALYKSGAEILGMTFKLAPAFEVETIDLPNNHRECRVKCILNGLYEGVGSCSTMETKYRYRKSAAKYTILDSPIPSDYKEKKADYRKRGFGCQKIENDWKWVQYEAGESEKVENMDPADQYNTVLKMAKKRAHVDAVITATGCSDIFTQDVEETAAWDGVEATATVIVDDVPKKKFVMPPQRTTPQPAPSAPAAKPPAAPAPAAPQAQAAPAQAPIDNNMPPLKDDGRPISEPQMKRLIAIACHDTAFKKQPWTRDQLDTLVKEVWGFSSKSTLTKSFYDRAVYLVQHYGPNDQMPLNWDR